MRELLADGLEIFDRHSGWIIWNLFLAFIPLVLSFWLFRRRSISRTWFWWIIYVIFIAFLPNAPYLLTDIVHLIRAIRGRYSVWIITLIFIPLHTFAILSGLEAYVVSLINQNHYLRKQGAKQYIFLSEILTHLLCAIGVFMGRFRRFNSWDLVTQPDVVFVKTLDDLTTKKPLLVIFITFLAITISYSLMKQVTFGLMLQFRRIYLGLDELDPEEILKR
ncbi:conserved membrane hypothetical protein [Planktothrix serta PCC 8927]|uniref:DUF1361 domain-containing protein n=1 Tax=Planktothrix serta PCC 8927 TaxID=671068 RepID=A0A7Z9BTL3_9CYAN|nr:DUF1361 domain-containing protein [Planktothrix serta]VXD22499.1 conserved membrane hypothetical protein [Planktothrix serta PCC 8927]